MSGGSQKQIFCLWSGQKDSRLWILGNRTVTKHGMKFRFHITGSDTELPVDDDVIM